MTNCRMTFCSGFLTQKKFQYTWNKLLKAKEQGKAKYVRIRERTEIIDKGTTSGHEKLTKGKKSHRQCSTRKLLKGLHLHCYLMGRDQNGHEIDGKYILEGVFGHLRCSIRQYIVDDIVQRRQRIQEQESSSQQDWKKYHEDVKEARSDIFKQLVRAIVSYWRKLKLPVQALTTVTSSIAFTHAYRVSVKENERNTFLHFRDRPKHIRTKSQGDAMEVETAWEETMEALMQELQVRERSFAQLQDLVEEFEQNISERLDDIASFLGSQDPKKIQSSEKEIHELFLGNKDPKERDVIGQELMSTMKEYMKTLDPNLPLQIYSKPSEHVWRLRRSSLKLHVGKYLGAPTGVHPDKCLNARSLGLFFGCVNGKFMPGAEVQIQKDGKHLVCCIKCEGRTLEEVKSRVKDPKLACECTRKYGLDDLEEYEGNDRRLQEALVPAHLHNLVVGPEECTGANNEFGALDLSRFLLFAQLCEKFGIDEAIDIIDSPELFKVTEKCGMKTVQLVGYRRALCTP